MPNKLTKGNGKMQTADLRTGKGLRLVLGFMLRVRAIGSVSVKNLRLRLGLAGGFYPIAGPQVRSAGPHLTRALILTIQGISPYILHAHPSHLLVTYAVRGSMTMH